MTRAAIAGSMLTSVGSTRLLAARRMARNGMVSIASEIRVIQIQESTVPS